MARESVNRISASANILSHARNVVIHGGSFYSVLGDLNHYVERGPEIEKEQSNVLEWLDPIFSVEGTCDWILREAVFQSWKEQTEGQDIASCLWIHGPAGFGKTFVSGRIIEHLCSTSRFPAAYFFCAYEDTD
ncbi:hypothetical protein Hypma_007436 [Hypsizygus marmoreus]|uniref:Nephrocystin 3-like N-terminal domain-containing protein n=1 Tax=Hypsizygus marmoreus TaxID=39966 RepID=A0A369JYJ8_HYPMA|nr:hypothetical protein Hypma_007436 [Hypsizygus marmoreus]